ncbi:polysaccharide deacetylase family protein [Natrinema halophilum]|uniref:Polysaccharide deacetylase family protein n=1 Tax=Natrinema halophilum TaxID=1699371 RepID=A0A7D5KSV2_9EURY|nr:polysaccharide deacetylase family protein [Natrinema halophilum]QLG50757.1 polysaccharide deacetylase family protein [Natrinema halophilum]
MVQKRASRRRFLAIASATGIAGMAGCADRINNPGGNGNDNNESNDSSDKQSVPGLTDGVPALETKFNSREQYGQPGESLDDFSNLDDWTVGQGTGEADTEIAFVGEQSFKLQSNGTEDIAVERSLQGEDLTEKDLSLALRTTTPMRITVNLRIVDQFGNQKVYSLRNITYRSPDVGWFRSSPGVFQQSSVEPSLDYLDRLEIRVLHSKPEAEVWFDDLRTHQTADNGYVMLSWDDGMTDYYDTAAPLHDEYGFSSVQAVIPRRVEQASEQYLSVSQLQERQDAGDQIVVHGTHNPMAELDDEEAISERLRKDKQWFLDNDFEGANYIVHPHNSFDKTSLEQTTNYHYCGGFNQAGHVNMTSVYGFDPLVLPRTIGNNLDIAKQCVDLAAQHNQCTILNFHRFDADNTMSKADYESLLEYIDGSDIEVIDFDDLWKLRTSNS